MFAVILSALFLVSGVFGQGHVTINEIKPDVTSVVASSIGTAIAEGYNLDAFGRLRVSEPYTLFDSKQLHDSQPLFWDQITNGVATGTHVASNAATHMVVTASTNDYVIRQTKQRPNYQPGKSQFALMTFRMNSDTGVVCRVGQFDGIGTDYMTANNGIFLQCSGSSISWNIAKNGTTTQTKAREDWNIDKMDGTGASGLTLDLTGTIIAMTDFEWLGVGRVRVGFVVGGAFIYVHEFLHSNTGMDSVYMQTPNLPVRYDIRSTGGAGSLDHICVSVISEGGSEETGTLTGIDTGNAKIDIATIGTTYAILGLQLQTNKLDVTTSTKNVTTMARTASDYIVRAHINPTLSAGLTYTNVTDSALQKAVGDGVITVTDFGKVVSVSYVTAGGNQARPSGARDFVSTLKLGSKIDGTRDQLIISVTPLTGDIDIFAAIVMQEQL